MVDNEISCVEIIDLRRGAMRRPLFMGVPFVGARSAKDARRINRRSLPNKVHSRVQLDLIYGFYSGCI